MTQHIGVKLINAYPMNRQAYNDLRGWQLPEDENGSDEGYLVEYLDGGKPNTERFSGYVSWSPKEVFDKAYRPVSGLSFGLAVEALKSGKRVTRAGWNGKGLWLELVQQSPSVDLPYIHLIYPVPGNGAMPYPNGARVPWAPSQTDVLADDWQII
ncbi:DUF2829 domain-containing protein [Citrobacter freundii]|nr:DUF2829 domain-containing protein [Citrobacter freundii]